MRSSPLSQRGAAFLTFVALLSAVTILFVLGQASWQSRQLINSLQDVRAARVMQAADALRAWYMINAAIIESPGFVAPTGEGLLAAAGVPAQWGLSAGISSTQLVRGDIPYHAIAVWAPTDDDEQDPVFDPTTGELNLCPNQELHCGKRAAVRIDGYEIQATHYQNTVRNLRALALSAQAFFHAKWLADPDHNFSVNYFRGCDARGSSLPCMDSYEPLVESGLLEELGEPNSRAYDAWGGEVLATNGGPNNLQPPYRLALRAVTPWGAVINVYAVQRT